MEANKQSSNDSLFSGSSKIMRNRDILIIITTYIISHFLILIDQGIFWDDWTLFGTPVDDMFDQFSDNGRIVGGLLIKGILLSSFPVFATKATCFFIYLFTALLLYQILLTVKVFSKQDSLILTLFFAIFPVNFARLTLICLQYGVSYFLFFLGFFFVSKYFDSGKIIYRILAILILSFSFLMESLIPFNIVVLMYIAYKNGIFEIKNLFDFRKIITFVLKYFDFFIIPILCWFLYKKIFPIHGSFKAEGYNSIQLTKIITSPLDYFLIVQESFINILYKSVNLVLYAVIPFLIMVLIFNYFLKDHIERKDKSVVKTNNLSLKLIAVLAIIISFFGAFPYIVINKLPLPPDFISRHQILLPLGFSLFFYLLILVIEKILPKLSLKFILACSLSGLSLYNISQYIDFKRDWLGQQALIQYISKTPAFKANSTFIFQDNSRLNVDGREKRFYEYAGYFKHVFGDQTRIGFDNRQGMVSHNSLKVHLKDSFYNIKDYKIQRPQYFVIIEEGSYKIGPVDVLKMQLQYWIRPNAYFINLEKVLNVSYRKI